jgi:hypothetical protein
VRVRYFVVFYDRQDRPSVLPWLREGTPNHFSFGLASSFCLIYANIILFYFYLKNGDNLKQTNKWRWLLLIELPSANVGDRFSNIIRTEEMNQSS